MIYTLIHIVQAYKIEKPCLNFNFNIEKCIQVLICHFFCFDGGVKWGGGEGLLLVENNSLPFDFNRERELGNDILMLTSFEKAITYLTALL